MRALPGNTAPVLVSELMGDGTYEVQASDQLVFHGGRVDAVDTALHAGGAHAMEVAMPTDCGCPRPTTPVLLASAAPVSADANQLQAMHLGQANEVLKADSSPAQSKGTEARGTTSSATAEPGSETAVLPALRPNEKSVHIDVAPIIYQASAQEPTQKTIPLVEIKETRTRAATNKGMVQSATLPLQPTVAAPKRARRSFFGKIKGLMARIF
jgi:hypothetical protein